MCYYNRVKVNKEALSAILNEEIAIEEFERSLQSGFEFGAWPIVIDKGEGKKAELAHWEFIPYWYNNVTEVEEGRKKYTTLNAKGETILTSRIYKEAAQKRRCLVLSSGFYEWRHYKGKTYPYHIKVKDKELFCMAGVWQPWTDKETGERIDTFALLTTAANELMTQVHNNKKRMPTIFTDEQAREWLDIDLPEERIQKLATSHFPYALEAKTIIKNFREAEDPLEPFEYKELPPLQVA
jgi:putative SOS response-associated peptidase YedK